MNPVGKVIAPEIAEFVGVDIFKILSDFIKGFVPAGFSKSAVFPYQGSLQPVGRVKMGRGGGAFGTESSTALGISGKTRDAGEDAVFKGGGHAAEGPAGVAVGGDFLIGEDLCRTLFQGVKFRPEIEAVHGIQEFPGGLLSPCDAVDPHVFTH